MILLVPGSVLGFNNNLFPDLILLSFNLFWILTVFAFMAFFFFLLASKYLVSEMR